MREEEYYQNQREYYRLRRLAFPDHFREMARRSRPKHDRTLKKLRLFRYNSSQKGKDCRARYRKTQNAKQRDSLRSKFRKAVIKQAGENLAIARIYDRARELRQWFDVLVDHIIPISKGGIHDVNNLQIIYRVENNKKREFLGYKPSVVFT